MKQPLDSATSVVDSSWLLSFTDHVVSYAQELWAAELQLPNAPVPSCSDEIDVSFRPEIVHLVKTFAEASRRKYYLEWSCESYDAFVGGQDGQNERFEAALQNLYTPLDDILETRPASIFDKYDVLVLRYAPGAITANRQAQVFMDAPKLNETFEKNKPDDDKSWRLHPSFYRQDTDDLLLTPGLATLGFLQSQGHQTPGERVFVAGDLGGSGAHFTHAQTQAREWVTSNVFYAALMSAALAITNPEQYALARECLILLAKRSTVLEDALRVWPFGFTSVAAVSNRSAGRHRDRRSGKNKIYDVMGTIGGDRDVLIQFKGLGFTGRYDSGSLVVVPCHTHLHSVSESPVAERVAFAGFMKPTVVLDTKLDLPRLPTSELVDAIHIQQITARHSTI
ncbi:hypothetical protein PENSPDRAFT_694969 [Peniophora sp. CONT]|nr:hypothetical protein PENSPDRAFT_694969 [Peniophora sp. CONT]